MLQNLEITSQRALHVTYGWRIVSRIGSRTENPRLWHIYELSKPRKSLKISAILKGSLFLSSAPRPLPPVPPQRVLMPNGSGQRIQHLPQEISSGNPSFPDTHFHENQTGNRKQRQGILRGWQTCSLTSSDPRACFCSSLCVDRRHNLAKGPRRGQWAPHLMEERAVDRDQCQGRGGGNGRGSAIIRDRWLYEVTRLGVTCDVTELAHASPNIYIAQPGGKTQPHSCCYPDFN